ncbi:DUF6411 family protein [Streptomyces sp. NPDC048639]|uniref:DUF6411 family protein n=1 Tax=Streptomyces sp. NPDC048639 TaxID=3365581 RepID=UPI003712A038
MVFVAVAGVCVLLLVLAFLAPRLSRHPQRGAQKSLGMGARGAGKAPGSLGRWLSKPFHSSNRAVGRSGRAGRKGRFHMPF